MPLEAFSRVQPQDNRKAALDAPSCREFVALGEKLERVLRPVTASLPVDGRLIEDVELDPFVDNEITHGLGRPLIGYHVVRREAVLSAFRAQLSGNQTIATATATTAQLAQEDYDDGGCFDVSTYTYTAPVAGLYQFDFGAYLSQITSGRMSVWVRKNGSDANFYGIELELLTGTDNSPSNSTRLRLAADDTIELRVYHTHGADRTLQDNIGTFLAGCLVDEGITDRQETLSRDERASKLLLRCSYTQTVSLWVF